jgi:SAM-dependent methyltransferase
MSYQDRINNQLNQYADPVQLVKLPPIYHYWMKKHVIPKIESVFQVNNALDFYVGNIVKIFKKNGNKKQILSIGSGDCQLEIKIAKKIKETGCSNFRIECDDISPIRLERGYELAQKEGLTNFLSFKTNDINSICLNEEYSVILAHHSLHHIVELENLFDHIQSSLTENGRFLTIDMIGRNGHMRWPEALKIIESLWTILPEDYKFNHQFNALHKTFPNWDCSQKGFEGIRSQDILPLLLQNFTAEFFFAYGNIIDIFIERGYGHNFDINCDKDLRYIDFIELLNDTLINSGYLKPTIMWGVFGPHTKVKEQKYYKNRSAQYSVRQ